MFSLDKILTREKMGREKLLMNFIHYVRTSEILSSTLQALSSLMVIETL